MVCLVECISSDGIRLHVTKTGLQPSKTSRTLFLFCNMKQEGGSIIPMWLFKDLLKSSSSSNILLYHPQCMGLVLIVHDGSSPRHCFCIQHRSKEGLRSEGKSCLPDEMVSFCQEYNCLPRSLPTSTRIFLNSKVRNRSRLNCLAAKDQGRWTFLNGHVDTFYQNSASGKAEGRRGRVKLGKRPNSGGHT